jgi:hypothetical protein
MAEHLVYLTVDPLDVKWAASMAECSALLKAAWKAELMVGMTVVQSAS